jgi:hypothetical protein
LDALSGSEEEIFEALLMWMRVGRAAEDGQNEESVGQSKERLPALRGQALLSKVRFSLMSGAYRNTRAAALIPEVESMQQILTDAAFVGTGNGNGPVKKVPVGSPLCAKALVPRMWADLAWETFSESEGEEERISYQNDEVVCLVEYAGHVCSGSKDGAVRIWDKATLEDLLDLGKDNDEPVLSLAVWEEYIACGHENGAIRVWRPESETAPLSSMSCWLVLRSRGHCRPVRALAVWQDRLLSGSEDHTVRVWRMSRNGRAWPCEQTLSGHGAGVNCMAAWEGHALSGDQVGKIGVWELATGCAKRVLVGHRGPVEALLGHGARLFSAGRDGTIREWAMGGEWAAVRTVEAYGPRTRQWVRCLSVSGSRLLSGSAAAGEAAENEVVARDLETLETVRTLRQPAGQTVWALLGQGGQVWGAVDSAVVVWQDGKRRLIQSFQSFWMEEEEEAGGAELSDSSCRCVVDSDSDGTTPAGRGGGDRAARGAAETGAGATDPGPAAPAQVGSRGRRSRRRAAGRRRLRLGPEAPK